MTKIHNKLGQPIGEPILDWRKAQIPSYTAFEGNLCRVEPIDVEQHSKDLFEAYALDKDGKMWTYMTYGPFENRGNIENWLDKIRLKVDPQFYVLVDKKTNKALGLSGYMRIKPEDGVIEIGGISFSPRLQRTATATEAMYLMMKRAFEDLGYRRYEWKCDAYNSASRKAAQRFGFIYEGTFKKHIIYKGRSRDTAWYSVLDDDWPALKKAYKKWLASENFDVDGKQVQKLADLIMLSRA